MLLLSMLAAQATPDRGLWMHYHTGNPLGLGEIVNDPGKEALAHTRFSAWGIKRVYGGYKTLPVAERASVAAWNSSLDAAGIESQLLLGEATSIFPGADCRDELLGKIDDRLIDFNLGIPGTTSPLPANQRFKALHLDLEPHQFKPANYGTGGPPACAPTALYWTPATRAVLFAELHDTLVAIRAHLDANGLAAVPIYIDLPFWIDSSPNFDWSTTPGFVDGEDWLQQTSSVVDGYTIMTYETDNASDIRDDIDGEQLALPTYTIRPSVNPKERVAHSASIHTWTYIHELVNVVEELESSIGGMPEQVDIHNYRYLFSPWPFSIQVSTGTALINALWGRPVVHPTAKKRLRPQTLQSELAEIQTVATNAGCTAAEERVWMGAYSRGAGTGERVESGDEVNFTYANRQVNGTVGPQPFGSDWSGTARTRVLADIGEGYFAGRWVRVRGRHGIWLGIDGACEPGLDVQEVFSTWYGSPIR